MMVTALVGIDFPGGTTVAEAAELFKQSAEEFRAMPGLIRKYCLFAPEGTVTAVCLWEDREAAERCFDEAWRRKMAQRYGAEPTVTYFLTPVVVDNALGVIEGDAIKKSYGVIAGTAAE